MAIIGKAVTKAYQGTLPERSYFFNGSTGGRQGHMLAQRYPKDFNGIVALFPAINWALFLFTNIYPAFIRNIQKIYPPPCEIQVFQNAALVACEGLDGVEDEIISKPRLYHLDPYSIVGKSFKCNGADYIFSEGAADFPIIGSAATECNAQGSCKVTPFSISDLWARYWVAKDPYSDLKTIAHSNRMNYFKPQRMNTGQLLVLLIQICPDSEGLAEKMINGHVLTDQFIPVNGSIDDYGRVLKRDPQTQDFYQLYLAPCISHYVTCGIVPSVLSLMNNMRDWMKHGKAYEMLIGAGTGPDGTKTAGVKLERDLCMYPCVKHYVGDDSTKAEAFTCVREWMPGVRLLRGSQPQMKSSLMGLKWYLRRRTFSYSSYDK